MNEQRKYSISEIGQMRQLVGWLLPWGYPMPMSDRFAIVEEALRTHMLNGTTLEELQASLKQSSRHRLTPVDDKTA